MRINQIFSNSEESGVELLLQSIKIDCCDFITESQGLPVFKLLPSIYEDFQRVKVRKHKQKSKFNETFNKAFGDEVRDLRERSVFVNGQEPEPETEKDAFYVFPKNGFKYMYCTEVRKSNADYRQVFDSIFENVDQPEDVIRDLLKFSYTQTNLYEGIEANSEIIVYNIPYYYSIRTTLYPVYEELLTDVSEV